MVFASLPTLGNINRQDTIYFKDGGEPVKIKATADKVIQFENLTPAKVKKILYKYAKDDGLGVDKNNINAYFELFKNKKYCLLIFLKNPEKVKQFEIDKSGFGAMAAWITVDSLDKIKKKSRGVYLTHPWGG
ncbi:MAG: hypothetical protein ABIB61_03195 [Candidatus Shapirobacteria bacterium]